MRHSIAPVPVADPVRDELRTLRAEIAALRDRVVALEGRGRGARDQADEQLFVMIGDTFPDRRFTSRDVWLIAETTPCLAEALTQADISSTAELGQWLRQLVYRVTAGLLLERVDRSETGIVWRIRAVLTD
jgi:hypothetical protein